jgi:hypothetical protein
MRATFVNASFSTFCNHMQSMGSTVAVTSVKGRVSKMIIPVINVE